MIKKGMIFNLSVKNSERNNEKDWCFYIRERTDNLYEHSFYNFVALKDFDLKEEYLKFLETVKKAEEDYFKYDEPKIKLFIQYLIKNKLTEKFEIHWVTLVDKPKTSILKSRKVEVFGEEGLHQLKDI